MNIKIPFNKPYLTGNEINYINDAHQRGQLAGDGYYTKLCSSWLKSYLNCDLALLTHSCTAALEMAAILIDIQPGDEVIMPSYTFVSTANAFVLRGATPVFVDIRLDTLNIDENLIEDAITDRTKAIVVVHYAGVICEMDAIIKIAERHNLFVIEDAAQALASEYHGKPAGSIGDIACFSFHETKNIISGEGGAIVINNNSLSERAEIIREKGTNRSRFFRGQVDKYTWVDIGSSYLPGEIIAAFLWAQLECAEQITQQRLFLWEQYQHSFNAIQSSLLRGLPQIPSQHKHNAHIYYLLLESLKHRSEFIDYMKAHGISTVFHYVPLHNSPMGKHAKLGSSMTNTEYVSDRLVRLPLWVGLNDQMSIIKNAKHWLEKSEG